MRGVDELLNERKLNDEDVGFLVDVLSGFELDESMSEAEQAEKHQKVLRKLLQCSEQLETCVLLDTLQDVNKSTANMLFPLLQERDDINVYEITEILFEINRPYVVPRLMDMLSSHKNVSMPLFSRLALYAELLIVRELSAKILVSSNSGLPENQPFDTKLVLAFSPDESVQQIIIESTDKERKQLEELAKLSVIEYKFDGKSLRDEFFNGLEPGK